MVKVAKFIIGWPISLTVIFFIVKITYPHFKIIFSDLEIVFLIIFIFILSTPILNRVNINLINRFLPLFSPKTNLIIFLIAVTYTFFFGLGTYFAAISVAYLSPGIILSLIGFFVLSLVSGYLSVIAPMGIGIREGIITIGLSKHLSLTTSGFISIFARILLIFSEICFVILITFWYKAKNKYIMVFENFIWKHKQEVALVFFIVVYIAYFTTASFLRYDNFYTGRFDLGNMDQAVWNTINGRIFELTDPNGTEIVSRLAFHADFILILLSPFYLLWKHPKMLLLIQTVVLAMGAIFAYKLAKNIIKNKNLSFVIGVSFLLNPAVQYTNLYDFHAVTLSTTFLLGAFYFLYKKRYMLFLLFALLAAITKEQIWVVIAIFGLYVFFSHKNKKILGITVFIVSLVIFYYLIWHAIPNALGSQHFALSYYSDFGDSPTSIVRNIFLSPQKTFSTFFQKDQLSYLNQLFLPLGFFSFLSPINLIFALPDLFINLLSSKPQLHQIYYQYSSTITPFIFISSIFAITNLKKWFPKIPRLAYVYCLLFTVLYSAYTFGPLPGAKKPNIAMFTKQLPERKTIDNFLSTISSKYSVSATNNLGSHLSHRRKVFTIPVGIDQADYVVFLLNDSSPQLSLREQREMVSQIQNSNRYIEVFRKGDFVAFKQTKP